MNREEFSCNCGRPFSFCYRHYDPVSLWSRIKNLFKARQWDPDKLHDLDRAGWNINGHFVAYSDIKKEKKK